MSEDSKKIKIKPGDNKPNNDKDSILTNILDLIKTIAIALILAFLIKSYVVDATKVAGNSMLNTLHNNDMLLVNKIGKNFSDYKRGDIVILQAPDYKGRLYVKRIVGEPFDVISLKNEKVYVNGEELEEKYTSVPYTLQTSDIYEWHLSDDEYFVMGDNREVGESNDSRNFGPISKSRIVGHAFLRFYPFNDIGLIDNNPYRQ